MTTTPAGWYPDPEAPGQQRYWDGRRWTDLPSPGAAAAPSWAAERPTQLLPVSARPDLAWYQRKPVLAVGAVVALLAIGSAFGGGSDEDEAPTPASASVDTSSSQGVTEVTDAAADEPELVEPVEEPVQEPVEEPVDDTGQVGTEAPATGDTFALPDETGKTLQAAQDDVQAVSGNPFFYTDSDDATGAGRFQALDSGWQVCSQTPAAGSVVDIDSIITFHVVRVSESCP